MKRTPKRVLSIALAFCLALSLFAGALPSAMAVSYKDVNSSYWAASYISYLSDKGVFEGYPDGKFKPDDTITKAEFITVLNRTFGLSRTGSAYYSDVNTGAWYYNYIQQAAAQGYLLTSGNAVRPDLALTRQEAVALISRYLALDTTTNYSSFKDYNDISAAWRDYVGAAVAAGIINGYPDGSFKPNNTITRAEAAKIVYFMLGGNIIRASTSGNATGGAITAGNVTLSNSAISGTLYISEGADGSSVYITGSSISRLVIRGSVTVYLQNTQINNLVVNPSNGSATVRATGSSKIYSTTAKGGTALSDETSAGGAFANVNSAMPNYGTLSLTGIFPNVSVSNPYTTLSLATDATKVESLTIGNTANNTTVTGKGIITKIIVSSAGTNVQQLPQNYAIGTNLTAVFNNATYSGTGSTTGTNTGFATNFPYMTAYTSSTSQGTILNVTVNIKTVESGTVYLVLYPTNTSNAPTKAEIPGYTSTNTSYVGTSVVVTANTATTASLSVNTNYYGTNYSVAAVLVPSGVTVSSSNAAQYRLPVYGVVSTGSTVYLNPAGATETGFLSNPYITSYTPATMYGQGNVTVSVRAGVAGRVYLYPFSSTTLTYPAASAIVSYGTGTDVTYASASGEYTASASVVLPLGSSYDRIAAVFVPSTSTTPLLPVYGTLGVNNTLTKQISDTNTGFTAGYPMISTAPTSLYPYATVRVSTVAPGTVYYLVASSTSVPNATFIKTNRLGSQYVSAGNTTFDFQVPVTLAQQNAGDRIFLWFEPTTGSAVYAPVRSASLATSAGFITYVPATTAPSFQALVNLPTRATALNVTFTESMYLNESASIRTPLANLTSSALKSLFVVTYGTANTTFSDYNVTVNTTSNVVTLTPTGAGWPAGVEYKLTMATTLTNANGVALNARVHNFSVAGNIQAPKVNVTANPTNSKWDETNNVFYHEAGLVSLGVMNLTPATGTPTSYAIMYRYNTGTATQLTSGAGLAINPGTGTYKFWAQSGEDKGAETTVQIVAVSKPVITTDASGGVWTVGNKFKVTDPNSSLSATYLATITIGGTTYTAQAITPGIDYYVHADGTVATTPDTALPSDKIITIQADILVALTTVAADSKSFNSAIVITPPVITVNGPDSNGKWRYDTTVSVSFNTTEVPGGYIELTTDFDATAETILAADMATAKFYLSKDRELVATTPDYSFGYIPLGANTVFTAKLYNSSGILVGTSNLTVTTPSSAYIAELDVVLGNTAAGGKWSSDSTFTVNLGENFDNILPPGYSMIVNVTYDDLTRSNQTVAPGTAYKLDNLPLGPTVVGDGATVTPMTDSKTLTIVAKLLYNGAELKSATKSTTTLDSDPDVDDEALLRAALAEPTTTIITLGGDIDLAQLPDLVIQPGQTLIIPAGVTLGLGTTVKIQNAGSVIVRGTLDLNVFALQLQGNGVTIDGGRITSGGVVLIDGGTSGAMEPMMVTEGPFMLATGPITLVHVGGGATVTIPVGSTLEIRRENSGDHYLIKAADKFIIKGTLKNSVKVLCDGFLDIQGTLDTTEEGISGVTGNTGATAIYGPDSTLLTDGSAVNITKGTYIWMLDPVKALYTWVYQLGTVNINLAGDVNGEWVYSSSVTVDYTNPGADKGSYVMLSTSLDGNVKAVKMPNSTVACYLNANGVLTKTLPVETAKYLEPGTPITFTAVLYKSDGTTKLAEGTKTVTVYGTQQWPAMTIEPTGLRTADGKWLNTSTFKVTMGDNKLPAGYTAYAYITRGTTTEKNEIKLNKDYFIRNNLKVNANSAGPIFDKEMSMTMVVKIEKGEETALTKTLAIAVADQVSPVVTAFTPADGVHNLFGPPEEDFVITVTASDAGGLYELEVDHNIAAMPEFSVYASATDPTGGKTAEFNAAGISVTYASGTWTLTFKKGGAALNAMLNVPDVQFYIVVKDAAGNTWGTMSPPEAANTHTYTIINADLSSATLTAAFDGSANNVKNGRVNNTFYYDNAKKAVLGDLTLTKNIADAEIKYQVKGWGADTYGATVTTYSSAITVNGQNPDPAKPLTYKAWVELAGISIVTPQEFTFMPVGDPAITLSGLDNNQWIPTSTFTFTAASNAPATGMKYDVRIRMKQVSETNYTVLKNLTNVTPGTYYIASDGALSDTTGGSLPDGAEIEIRINANLNTVTALTSATKKVTVAATVIDTDPELRTALASSATTITLGSAANFPLDADLTIPDGKTLIIPSGAKLFINDRTVTNNGAIQVAGDITLTTGKVVGNPYTMDGGKAYWFTALMLAPDTTGDPFMTYSGAVSVENKAAGGSITIVPTGAELTIRKASGAAFTINANIEYIVYGTLTASVTVINKGLLDIQGTLKADTGDINGVSGTAGGTTIYGSSSELYMNGNYSDNMAATWGLQGKTLTWDGTNWN